MAGKVNYRFVALLSAVMIVCTLALVGVWYAFVRTDPAEAIARGDGAFERGRYAQAAALYGKALKVRTDDVSLILKYTEAIRPIEVSDVRSARQTIQRLQGAYTQVLELDPDNEQAIRRLMDLTMRVGEDLGDFEAWNQMLKTADTVLAANPDFTLARQYRGIAQVNRMESLDIGDEEERQALEDLQIAVNAYPGDADLAYHLVRWHLIKARDIARRTGMESEDVRFHRTKARQRSDELLGNHPDNPMRRLYHVRVLTALDEHERAMRMFDELESQLLENPNPPDVALAVADRLAFLSTRPGAQIAQAEGLQRTERLLRRAIEAHPDDLRFQVALGRTLTFQNRYDEAMQMLQTVAKADIQDTAVNVMRDSDLQQRAMTQHADLVLTLARDMPEGERERALEQVEALVRKLQASTASPALVSLLQGKIHIVREQWAEALKKLDRASTLYNDQNPEALLFSATARIQLGEAGAAIDRLEKLVRLRPGYMPARYELMRQLLRLGRFDQLSTHVDALLAQDPDNFEARRYAALMLARQGQVQSAIEMFEQLDPQANPALAAPLSQLYLATDQADRARELLQTAFAQAPDDASVLLQLLNLTDDRERASQYLSQAREAGVGERLITLLEQKIDGKLDADRVAAVERLINAEDDPFRRELNRYRLYRGLGRNDDAREALSQMAEIRPDDAMVIKARFDEALRQHDWEKAEQFADKARQNNLDLAHGLFYRGRLELARGEAQAAVATLGRALDDRGVYSQGWMYLGEAQQQVGDLAAAADSFRRAMQQNPGSIEAVRGLVAVLDAQRKYDEALQELRDVMARNPQSAGLLELYLNYEQDHGNRQRALNIRQRLAASNPDNTNNRRALAVLLANMQRYDEARRIVDELLTEEGRTRQNVFAAASVRGMSGDVEGARQLMQQYIDSLGADATMDDWLAVARFLMRTNEVASGLEAYKQAIRREDAVAAPATRELADRLFAMGRNADAAELYRRLYDRDRNDQRVAYRYVESLIRSDNFEQAQSTLDEILSRNEPTASAYLLASLIAREQGEHETALHALNNAADIDPDRAMIYFERAQVRRAINEMDPRIKRDLERAIELDPQLAAARRQLTQWHISRDDRAKAIDELIALMQQHPRDVSTRVQLAELLYADRQHLQLHALLQESSELFPDSPVWPHMQARLYAEQGKREKAAAAFERAFKLQPTAERLAELGTQWLALGRTGDLLTLMRDHDDLADDSALLLSMRARALGAEGFSEQSHAMFGHALSRCESVKQTFDVATHLYATLPHADATSLLEAVDGDRVRPWAQMAIARATIDAGDHQQAVERLRRIESQVSSLSDDRLAYFRLVSTAQYAMRDYQQAVEAYERILELDADNLFALNNLAYLMAEDLDRTEEALSLARRAVRIAPHNAQVLDTLGWVQHHAGMQEQAVKTLKQSVHLDAFATNCYHLAVAYETAGEYRQAHEMLTTARNLAEQEQNQELLKRIELRIR